MIYLMLLSLNLISVLKLLFNDAVGLYNEMLAAGVAKETARDVLPLSTPTKMYMHGTLGLGYIIVTYDVVMVTQLEHKEIADQIKELIAIHFPIVYTSMWNEDTQRTSD